MNSKKCCFLIFALCISFFSVSCTAMQPIKLRESQFALPTTQEEKREFVDEILGKLRENYIKESVIISKEVLLRQELLKVLNQPHENIGALAADFTVVLQRVVNDKHLGVRLARNAKDPEQLAARLQWMDSVRYGIAGAHVDGGVGYLKLTHFVWPREFDLAVRSAEPLRRYVHDAFALLNDAKALIIDLRDNEGGSPEMVAAISSFILEAHMPLNEFRWRDPNKVIYKALKNSPSCFRLSPATLYEPVDGITVERFATIDEEAIFGFKSKLKAVPVVLLTNSKTFSAGEEFAYNLKQMGRATIVGETTAGGANPWYPIPLQYGLDFLVPNGEAVNPISKTNWEGKGVEPDVEVRGERALEEAKKILAATIN